MAREISLEQHAEMVNIQYEAFNDGIDACIELLSEEFGTDAGLSARLSAVLSTLKVELITDPARSFVHIDNIPLDVFVPLEGRQDG